MVKYKKLVALSLQTFHGRLRLFTNRSNAAKKAFADKSETISAWAAFVTKQKKMQMYALVEVIPWPLEGVTLIGPAKSNPVTANG